MKDNLNPNPAHSLSQVQCVKNLLLSGRKITALEALRRYQTLRLSARIWDLRHAPHNLSIKKEMVLLPNGKRVAEYSLIH